MPYTIEVKKYEDGSNVIESEFNDAKMYMAGLVDALGRGYSYVQGCRNNLAVDICIGCYCLGLEPMEFWNKLVYLDKVDGRYTKDFMKRSEIIMPYCDEWEANNGDIWVMAINEYRWMNIYLSIENPNMIAYHDMTEHDIEFKEV